MSATALYGSSTVKRCRRSRAELAEVDEAISQAVAEEHPVTLRGVYYRVVSVGAVDKTENDYRLVGRRLLRLRRDRAISYDHITDGTRWIIRPTTHGSLQQMLDDAAGSYRRQLWRDQPVDVHLFVEKDAMSGVVHPVTERWDVPLGVLRGYCSESFAYSVADAITNCGKRAIFVYQLGDHDPSGVDAWRAFRESVARFLGEPINEELATGLARHGYPVKAGDALGVEECGAPADYPGDICEQVTYGFLGGPGFHRLDRRTVTFARLAVTEDQITEMALPTRPTKASDTRAAKFTGDSVDVDAIPPRVLRDLVENAIRSHIDPRVLALHEVVERQERAGLAALAAGGVR